MGVSARYKDLVWWTMDVVGVSQSIERKVLMAVGIQFAVSVALTLVLLFVSGALRLWLAAGLFGLAIVAFVNTVLVVRADLIGPILALEDASRRIEGGNLDVDVPATDQQDELGSLSRSFDDMRGHLGIVTDQAEALAAQEFDAPALDRDIPGRFGAIMGAMTASVTEYVQRIERDRDRFQLLNYLVGHDVPNVITIIHGRLGLLRQRCDDEDSLADIDLIEDQIEEIEYISNTVADLTSAKSVRRIDVTALIEREIDRIRDSFPDATVSLDVPDEPVPLRTNDLLSRVFENLIVNGIEHNDADDPRVDVEVTDAGTDVEVEISDNGPGIDIADSDSLFASVEEGTGLNIVHTIVRSYEGEIDLVESSSAGTTLVVRLPRGDDPDDTEDPDADADWVGV